MTTIERFAGSVDEWNAFVTTQSGWTHFHLYGWRRIIERVFHHDCVYLAARDRGGSIVGVLPLVSIHSWLLGNYMVSMPFLNYGGPLGTPEAIRALVARAVDHADSSGTHLVELRSREALPIDLPVSHRKVTVLLPLRGDAEEMWAALPSKLRSQIKRPKKDGVDVVIGLDQMPAFYGIFARHMRDLGTPVLPRRFFEACASEFPADVRFAVAYHRGIPIACGCGFLWNGEFEITWASALRSYKAMSPNMLVYWELMRRSAADGAAAFNFGRSTPDSGPYRFKMQWGGRPEPLWWYQYRPRGMRAAPSTPSPDRGVYSLATKLWQRLPVPVATWLGPRIVRFIP